jgi:hypothetical protein
MVNIKELLIELKYELFKNMLLTTFLKTAIAFFIFDIIGSLIGLWYGFSIIFAGSYLLIKLRKQMKKINLKKFEEHNPQIKDMLMTAADNASKENIVVNQLFMDVISHFKKISSGTLIVPQTVLIMILILPVLAVVNFETSPLHIDAISQDTLLENMPKITIFESFFNRTLDKFDRIKEDELLDDDIYGEVRVARAGIHDIEFKMNHNYETDFTRPGNERLEDITFKDFPEATDIEIIQDSESLNEHIEESDLARKYNEKIRNMR